MQKLLAFESISLDGYFTGKGGDLSWAHETRPDREWNEFVAGNARSGGSDGGALLMGRVTYDMMIQYWPTAAAAQNDPEIARHMNSMPKYVLSRTMKKADWENTTVLRGDLPAEVRKLKEKDGKGITVLGSGTIVSQLVQEGLLDELQLVVVPVALGEGRSLFEGSKRRVDFELASTRSFRNGNVVLSYLWR